MHNQNNTNYGGPPKRRPPDIPVGDIRSSGGEEVVKSTRSFFNSVGYYIAQAGAAVTNGFNRVFNRGGNAATGEASSVGTNKIDKAVKTAES